MSRIRYVVLSALAILAVAGLVPTSAYAECEEATFWQICEGAGAVLTTTAAGNIELKLSSAPFLIETTGGAIHIECKEWSARESDFAQAAALAANTTGAVTIEFDKNKDCTVVKPANCAITEPFVAKGLKVSVAGEEVGEKLGINFKPEKAGGAIMTINLKNVECLIAGKNEVKGEITCHLHKFLQDEASKELLCLHTDKGLTLAAKAASLEFHTLLTLKGIERWAMDLT